MLKLSVFSWSDPISHAKIQDSALSLSLTHWLFQNFISWLALCPRFLRRQSTRNFIYFRTILFTLTPQLPLISEGKFYRLKMSFEGWGIGSCWLLENQQRTLVWNKIYSHHLSYQVVSSSTCHRRGPGKQTQDHNRSLLGQDQHQR